MNVSNQHEQEAAAWAARSLSGEITKSEKVALQNWLAQSPENRTAYAAYEEAAHSLDYASETLLADHFEAELHAQAERQEAVSTPWASIAAGLVALLAGVLLLTITFRAPQPQLLATAYGERAEQILSDGSSVQLNTKTKLEITYRNKERLAQFNSGEALFDVERNPTRPFVVKTRHADIVVTGTVFNVLSLKTGTIVSVVSGAVDVTPAAGERITLMAGQKLNVDTQGRASAVEAFNPNTALAWREGKTRYAKRPLGEVIEDLNRYFSQPIILGDPKLATLPVTGEFDVSDQETIISALSVAFSLEARETPSAVLLSTSER
ncbi:MAG: FecR domain-containing protein [Pseudomonadota bacterium]